MATDNGESYARNEYNNYVRSIKQRLQKANCKLCGDTKFVPILKKPTGDDNYWYFYLHVCPCVNRRRNQDGGTQ